MKRTQGKLSLDRPSESRKSGITREVDKLAGTVQRLTIDFPAAVHTALKVKAAESGRSMRELVVEAVEKIYKL